MAKELPNGAFWNKEHTKIFLVRCPKCHAENWAPSVSSGICAWCGYNINADKEY